MAKYYSNSNSGVFASDGGACSTSAASDGAVAFDPPTHTPPPSVTTMQTMCWKIAGRAVVINDTYMSYHAGFEMANYNMHIDGTQPAVPSQFHLPVAGV